MLRDTLETYNFETSQEAWEMLNGIFFMDEKKFAVSGGAKYGYDMFIKIKKPWVDPKFNFARMFNYHDAKWIMLQNNYLDIDELNKVRDDLAKRDYKASSHWTHTLRFHNKKENGKECLISLTISKRQGELEPVLVMHTRAIEVTKRFLLDLLLVQRIGEYILPNIKHSLIIYCPMVYQDADTFTMYHTHKKLHNIIKDCTTGGNVMAMILTKWQERVFKALNTFMTTPLMEIKYKVNRRCAKQLQTDEFGFPLGSGKRQMLAKDLKLKTDHGKKRKEKID
jgi:hypothetical protein